VLDAPYAENGGECVGRSRRGLHSKPHIVCASDANQLILLLMEEWFSNCEAAFDLFDPLPTNITSIAGKTRDNHQMRNALRSRGMSLCIPLREGQWADGRFDPA